MVKLLMGHPVVKKMKRIICTNLKKYIKILNSNTNNQIQAHKLKNILIFSDDKQKIQSLKELLESNGQDIILVTVSSGDRYQCINLNNYVIRPGDKQDYELLFKALLKSYPNVKWNNIVNLWGEPVPLSEINLSKGIYHLLTLTQVLLSYKESSVNLLHIYQYAADVLTLDEMNNGFVRSLKEEHPGYVYKLIGIDQKAYENINLSKILVG